MDFVSVQLKDGLGNQLFYMAAAFGYGRRYGRTPAILCATQGFNPHTDERFEHTLFGEFEKINQGVDAVYKEGPEDCLMYREIPMAQSRCANLFLHGFFQHENYLGGFKEEFVEKLRLPGGGGGRWGSESELESECERSRTESERALENTCFVHVRRGDYLVSNSKHYVPLEAYYQRALDFVRNKRPGVRFLVFSDDIAWCRRAPMFGGGVGAAGDIEFCEETHDVTALVLMSQCQAGGICANSTFSWWGAFLRFREGDGRIVTFPDTWFSGVSWQNDIAFRGSFVLPTK